MFLTSQTGRAQVLSSAVLLVGMAATVGGALAFQHIGGFIPCKLCLGQRTPYYIGVPLMALALLSAVLKGPAVLTRGLLLAGAALMAWGAYLGGFHSGVEWGWWAGPTDCGAVSAPQAGNGTGGILDQIDAFVPPSCDQAAGRFLGLSFAGWNVIASVILLGVALRGAIGRA